MLENCTFIGEEDLLRSRGVDVHVLPKTSMESKVARGLMTEFIKRRPDVWNEDIGE